MQAIASRSRQMAVVAKIADGNLHALMVALIGVLDQWILDLDDHARGAERISNHTPAQNAAGKTVGHMWWRCGKQRDEQ